MSTRLWLGAALLAGALWTGAASGGLLAIGTSAVAPFNDNFASAVALSGADVTRTGDTNVGATLQAGEATTVAGALGGTSVWYSWTAPANGMVVVDTTTSDFDTLLGVYTGTAVDSLAEVASNDDFVPPPASRLRFAATSGAVYRIRVDGFNGDAGTINLHVHQAAPPANDSFAGAITLSTQDATRTGDTNDGATLEAGEAGILGGDDPLGGASVWYRWTAPVTGRVTLDTATSTFDTLLGVYSGGSLGGLSYVAGNDDTKVPPTSLIRFSAVAGTIYSIRVDGFAEATGTINLHLHEVLPAASPANDNFANAITLSGMNASRSGDTNAGAGLESGEATVVAGEAAAVSVWYSWTAPATGTATIDTATSGFDTMLGVYTGSAVNSLSNVASNDDVSAATLTSRVRFQATLGVVYRIRVDGYATDTGTINLHLDEVLLPANDDFANGYILSGTNVSQLGDTNLGATLQTGEPNTIAGQTAGNSIWYRWTAPISTAVTIDTATSDFDTLIGVYTGNAVNALTDVASNDNAGGGLQTSKVSFPITAGTEYRIRVDGVNGATGTTVNLHLALATVSDVPTNVTATPGAGQATVSWIAPSDDGGSTITGYEITRYVSGVAEHTISVGPLTQATVPGLTNGTTYTFKVAATNIVGTGQLSKSSNPVTPRTVPEAPTSISATAGAGQATVSWTAPAFSGGSAITGYAITRYVGGVAQGTSNVGVVTQASVGGLTNGTTYTFRVAAKNVAGTGAQSSDSNAVMPQTVPDAPATVNATPGAGQATVSWSVPANGGSPITGYDVTAYVGGVAQSTMSVGAVAQTTVTGLTNGTAYTFRVAAKNALGTGVASAASSAVTPRRAPDAPTIGSAAASGAGQVTLSWSAPAFDGGSAITGYEVTSYVAGAVKLKISVGVVSQATFGGLTNGTAYTFRVAAKNVAGTGAESADSNAVTPAVPRFTFTVAKSGNGSGTVTAGGAINCGATCAADFDTGTSVTLTAVPSSGSTFAGWSGPCTGIGSCTVWIDAAKTVTAKFTELESQPQPTQGAKCVVPKLKRQPLATAKRKIVAAHCRTGKVTNAKSASVPKGRVIASKPPAGKKLAAGTKINLVASRGKR